MSTVRVAVVQAAPVAFDRERTLEKVASLAADAAGRGARLVVFPEAFVCAYPKGATFGAVVGSRTPAGRDEFKRYWETAVDVPEPAVDQLSDLARSLGIHLVVPVIERSRGTMYCTALFFSSEGLGKHRKLVPTAAERLVWDFGDGSTLPVFDTSLGRIGARPFGRDHADRRLRSGRHRSRQVRPRRDRALRAPRHLRAQGQRTGGASSS